MLMPTLSFWGAVAGAGLRSHWSHWARLGRFTRPHTVAPRAATLWCLRPGQAAGVRTHGSSELRVLEGQLWVTLGAEAGQADHCLGPGEVLAVPPGAHLVMEPLALRGHTGPVRVAWSGTAGTPQAAPSGWSQAQ